MSTLCQYVNAQVHVYIYFLYRDPDVICTSSNKAYHTVSQIGGTSTDYETVFDPHTVPPSTSCSSPTAGDYEEV